MAFFQHTYVVSRGLMQHRRLLREMVKRDIVDRYAGQALGSVWAVIHPLLTIAVFVTIFGVVFRVKAQALNISGIPADHTLYMLSGLIPWLVMADVLGRSPSLIISQASLVKQVVFPIEILPAKIVLATLPMFLICISGLLVYTAYLYKTIPVTFIWFIPASFILYITMFGISFLLSSIGVFLKDTKDLVAVYMLLGMYMAPIFYYMNFVPEKLRFIVYCNPMTYIVQCFHEVFYYKMTSGWECWGVATGIGLVGLFVGCFSFNRFKTLFGNFL